MDQFTLGGLALKFLQGWLERNRDRPFFLYFALNMPHYPYQGDAKWLERYQASPYPRNLYARDASMFAREA